MFLGMLGFFKRKDDLAAAEALGILGLPEKPNRDQIRNAYLTKMRKNHPDLGGSEYLAAQINWARDVLLSKH